MRNKEMKQALLDLLAVRGLMVVWNVDQTFFGRRTRTASRGTTAYAFVNGTEEFVEAGWGITRFEALKIVAEKVLGTKL